MILKRLSNILRSNMSGSLDDWRDEVGRQYEQYREQFTGQKTEKTAADSQAQNTEAEYERHRQQQQAQNASAPAGQEREYYRILEVTPGADFEQIRKAYKRLMKLYHPDRYHADPEKQQVALEISRQLNAAYVYFEKKHNRN